MSLVRFVRYIIINIYVKHQNQKSKLEISDLKFRKKFSLKWRFGFRSEQYFCDR